MIRIDIVKTAAYFALLLKDVLEEVESRKIFWHWEIDTLIGARAKNNLILLILIERKTCFEIFFKIDQQIQLKVDEVINKLYEQLVNYAKALFKTITSNNGSEFVEIYEVLIGKTNVLFARPYAAYERRKK